MTTKLQIEEKIVESFCQENNYIFALTSAKEDIGIDDLFQNIAEKFLVTEGKLTQMRDRQSLNLEGRAKGKTCC